MSISFTGPGVIVPRSLSSLSQRYMLRRRQHLYSASSASARHRRGVDSHRPELPSYWAPDTRRLSRRAPVQLEASSSGVVADSPRTWIIAGKQFTSTQSSEIKTSKKYSHQTGNFGRSVAAHSPLRVGITIAMVGHPDALHRQRAPSAVRSGAPSKEASSMMEKPPRPGRRG
jgi:hypothetical protein